jgi:multidrug efflux pump subunit AcrA (membrane-fusion protein)
MINRILYRAGAFLLGIWHAVRALFIRLGWLKGSVLVVALLLIVGFGLSWLRGSTVSSEVSDTTRSVSVDSVSNLSQGGSALSVAGTVESQTEATVRAEKSGEVTAVYHALGDTVAAGTIVAELEDSSERAAVLQAQGAVQAATAGAQTSQTTLAAAQSGAVNVLLAAYSSADKVVHGDIDSMFSNPGSSQPVFNVQSANSQAKIDTESKRSTLNPILVREQARSSSLSTSDGFEVNKGNTTQKKTNTNNTRNSKLDRKLTHRICS